MTLQELRVLAGTKSHSAVENTKFQVDAIVSDINKLQAGATEAQIDALAARLNAVPV